MESPTENDEIKRLRSQIAALEQLLEVYEKAVVKQTDMLDQAQTEREQLFKEADEQRRLFQTVVANAPAGIALLWGPSFVFELVNPAYEAIAPGKVLLGKTVAEAWPELASQVVPLLENVLRTGEPYSTVDAPFSIQRSPGLPVEQVYFTFSYVPLYEPEGKLNVILVLVTETTQEVYARQRTEELAREAQRRSAELQSIIDNMVEGVFVSDARGHVTLINKAGVQLLGMDRSEEAMQAIEEAPRLLRARHTDGSPVAPNELAIARALAGEIVIQDDQVIFNVKTQRDVYLRFSASPVKDENERVIGTVVLARDVTELMELDRLKDQFLEIAAHELKTPVTVVKGYAQLLLQQEHERFSPRGLRIMQAIDRQTDRISGLINDLLDITVLQHGELGLTMERVNLAELVEQSIDQAALTTTNHRIRVVQADPAVIEGDRGRLGEVMTNLLDNAIRYSPDGGDIDVEVTIRENDAVVSVKDYGVGIPKEKQDQIFQRFYRAHTGTPFDYGGMGVGLYISNEIVRRHGGKMWFESEEGKGSTFYFSLPLKEQS